MSYRLKGVDNNGNRWTVNEFTGWDAKARAKTHKRRLNRIHEGKIAFYLVHVKDS